MRTVCAEAEIISKSADTLLEVIVRSENLIHVHYALRYKTRTNVTNCKLNITLEADLKTQNFNQNIERFLNLEMRDTTQEKFLWYIWVLIRYS